jgi:hypothetical protein
LQAARRAFSLVRLGTSLAGTANGLNTDPAAAAAADGAAGRAALPNLLLPPPAVGCSVAPPLAKHESTCSRM